MPKKLKYSIEDVRIWIDKNHPKAKCLSNTFVNIKSKLLIECENKHQWKVSFDNIKNLGTWCPVCAGNKKFSIDEIKKFLIENNSDLTVLSENYINGSSLLLWKCSQNHIFKNSYAEIKIVCKCSTCFPRKLSKVSLEDIQFFFR